MGDDNSPKDSEGQKLTNNNSTQENAPESDNTENLKNTESIDNNLPTEDEVVAAFTGSEEELPPTEDELVAAFVDPNSPTDETASSDDNPIETEEENIIELSDEETNKAPTSEEEKNEDTKSEEVAAVIASSKSESKKEAEAPKKIASTPIKTAKPVTSAPVEKTNKLAIFAILFTSVLIIVGTVFAITLINSNKTDKPTVTISDLTDEQKEKLGIEPKKEDSTSASEFEDKNNYTEEYKKYLELSDEEKAEVEVIPRKEEVPDEVIEEIREDTDEDIIANLPEKFDLRNVIDFGVDNQGPDGLCWDFASSKALETHMKLRGKDYNPSEFQIDFLASDLMYGGYRTLHTGGNFEEYVDIASSIGTISEEKFNSLNIEPHGDYGGNSKNYDYFKLATNDTPLYITKTVSFPSIRKESGKVINKTDEEVKEIRNLIKAHIMTNGGLYMSTYSPENSIIRDSYDPIYGKINYYYAPDGDHTNHASGSHAMTIIGWDDNFSKDNFIGPETDDGYEKPIHDGAYLIINSWGGLWGDNGYYWVSYDDYTIESDISGIVSTSLDDTTKIDTIDSQLAKNLIENELNFYIINKNGEKYISDYALDRVSSLDLSSRNLNNNDLIEIAKIFPNISSLKIDNNNISDLSPLKDLKYLSYISVSNNSIKDISPLCSIDEIKSFNISYNKIDDISCFEGILDDYSSIDISGNIGITGFEKLTHLHSLTANEIGLNSLESLSNLRNLRELSVRDNNIKNLVGLHTDADSFWNIDVSGNKNLTNLTLDKPVSDLYIKDIGLTDISILNNIEATRVYASGNNFGDLSGFNNNKINALDLSGSKNLSNLSSLNTLKKLTISNCEITSLSDISMLNNINSLDLSNNEISSLEGIEKLEKLSSLVIDNNKLSSLDGISKATNLRTIEADNNTISNIDDLLKLKNLYFISFNNNNLTSIPNLESDSELYLAFSKNPIKKVTIPKPTASINLADCNIQSIDYSKVERLTSINLDGNPDWNEYSGLISKSMLGQQNVYSYTAYINISTDYNFSKNELDELNNIPGLSYDASWNISLKQYHHELEKSQDGTITIENNPNIRVIFMPKIKLGTSMDGFTIDKAATKIHLNNSTTNSLTLPSVWTIINNNSHIHADSIILDLK